MTKTCVSDILFTRLASPAGKRGRCLSNNNHRQFCRWLRFVKRKKLLNILHRIQTGILSDKGNVYTESTNNAISFFVFDYLYSWKIGHSLNMQGYVGSHRLLFLLLYSQLFLKFSFFCFPLVETICYFLYRLALSHPRTP